MNNRKLSVLLAEDNPISSKLAQINISKMGHKLDVVYNGQQAVEKFLLNKYDIILMDIEMPIMNGIDATKRIREIECENHLDEHIRIVAMTAHDGEEIKKYHYSGLDDYCSKPYKRDELSRLFQ